MYKNINNDFSVLVQEGYPVKKEDLKLNWVEDILKDDSIKITCNDSPVAKHLN